MNGARKKDLKKKAKSFGMWKKSHFRKVKRAWNKLSTPEKMEKDASTRLVERIAPRILSRKR